TRFLVQGFVFFGLEPGAVPAGEIARGWLAVAGQFGQSPFRCATLTLRAEMAGRDHDDEAEVLKLAEPAPDLHEPRAAECFARCALRQINLAVVVDYPIEAPLQRDVERACAVRQRVPRGR